MSTWRGSNNVACPVPEQGNWSWGCSAVTCDLDLHGFKIRNNPQLMPAEIQRTSPTQSGSRTGDQNDDFLMTPALFSLILHGDTSHGTHYPPTLQGCRSLIMAKWNNWHGDNSSSGLFTAAGMNLNFMWPVHLRWVKFGELLFDESYQKKNPKRNQVLHRCTTNSVLELWLMTKNLTTNYPTLGRKDLKSYQNTFRTPLWDIISDRISACCQQRL